MRAAMPPHFWLLADEPLQPLPSFFDTAALACVVSRALTFDMSCGRRAQPVGRQLDGRVRPHFPAQESPRFHFGASGVRTGFERSLAIERTTANPTTARPATPKKAKSNASLKNNAMKPPTLGRLPLGYGYNQYAANAPARITKQRRSFAISLAASRLTVSEETDDGLSSDILCAA